MSKNPPNCYICERNCGESVENCYYCICDITICNNCINSIKKNETTWICPHCKRELKLDESRLFRAT